MLKALYVALRTPCAALRVAAADPQVRDLLRAEGLEELPGNLDRRRSAAALVDEFKSLGRVDDEPGAT